MLRYGAGIFDLYWIPMENMALDFNFNFNCM